MTLFLNRRLFFILFGVLISAVSVAQEPVIVNRSNNKVILEGKVYYIHVVKPGQTLYSISRAYDISEKEIAIQNPGVMSGLQIGQALKIPIEPSLVEEIDTSWQEPVDMEVRTHTVLPGETVYGIARMYDISEELLLGANPGVSAENLRRGQKIIIPEKAKAEPEPAYNEEGFAYHRVKRRETLYSIGKFYQVDVQEIRNANPELGWGGPKTGQNIRIPLPQVIDHPGIEVDTIHRDSLFPEKSDTLDYYNYDELVFQHDDPDQTYRVVFFIPFDFRAPEPLDPLLKDVNSESRRKRIIERYRQEQQVPQATSFLEFFQGALMAIDTLQQIGMKMDVKFFDTKKSPAVTRMLLENEGMDEVDLIIGPFYPFNLKIVSDFSKEHRIPLVTPFYSELDLVSDNPYLFQLTPSIEREYREAARLIASRHTCNIVYVRDEDSLNIEKHDYFKELIFDGFDDYHPVEPVVFKEVFQKPEHSDEIVHSLSPDMKNLVVVPTRNEALASRIASSLYFLLKDFEIEVIGTPFWTEFSSIDYRYFHELSLIFYSSFWVDYLDPGVNDFLSHYRAHFYNEPRATTRKGINYGITGYEITFYFMNALRLHGPRFILLLDNYEPDMVLDQIDFSRINSTGGYENSNLSFFQFLPDMTIRRIEVPSPPERDYFFRPIDDRKRKYLNYEREWN